MKTLESSSRYAEQAVESVRVGDLDKLKYAVSRAYLTSRGIQPLLTALAGEVNK